MKQIGALVGLSAPSVLHRLRTAGIATRSRVNKYPRSVVEPLVDAGMSTPQIAAALGCSSTRVYQLLREYGLQARSGHLQPKPWRRLARVRFSGYWMLYRPEHPHADKRGRVMEHRLVMEEQLGRYLQPEEVVHHMNHVRDDNRPENLMVLPDQSVHMRLHNEAGRQK